MEIIILSKSLKQLNVDLVNTSSQVFEIEFARSLSQYAKVSIISLQANIKEVNKDISLYPIENEKKMKYCIKKAIEKNGLFIDRERIMLLFGYDYFILNNLSWVCKQKEAYLISYTFDTHKAALEHKNRIRRFLIDTYFQLGIKKLNSIGGIILFNEEAYKSLHLSIPYLISKVGINNSEISPVVYKRNENKCFNIVYAGSLERYNGIDEMISAIKLLPLKNIFLNIYGDGTLKNEVIRKSADDPRIHYRGIIPRGELDIVIENADLLLNLRDTKHLVSKFAFPSKLIQYLSSGIPVLSTSVLKDSTFNNVAFVIDELSSEKISDMIFYIVENPDEQQKRSMLAKDYIRKNFLWDNVIKDVYDFLRKISQSS
ncbi:glycosyltransferase family 4 protein [Niallia sp. Krafla_26]|uniref:glycosyltransferase family 4 protein n=1 Tax=Niallia sp. Krafla_26 TaxID=3064703 RepID=UPI003D168C84